MKYFNSIILILLLISTPLLADDPPHLPVELIYFKADVYHNIVLLSWGTATELNNYGFVVERSTNDQFLPTVNLGFVEGHGTSFNTWHYTFEDTTITSVGTYFYRLNQIDIDGNSKYSPTVSVSVTAVKEENSIKSYSFNLEQNFPNPFNPSTIINFSVPYKTKVNLTIYDLLGHTVRLLVNEELFEGNYSVEFNATNNPSGVYFYKLQIGNNTITKKMILQK